MAVSITLGFRRIECRRCGELRVVSVACPTCGMAPDEREVDPERDRRRDSARRAIALLNDPTLPPPSRSPSVVPEGVWDPLAQWAGNFLEALRDAIERDEEGRLLESIQALRQLKADCVAVPLLRPWVKTWRAIQEILERLDHVARLYLESTAAKTPLEAQRLQRDAQSLLDVAAAPAVESGDALERWSRVAAAGSSEEAIAIMAETAFTTSGAEDLLAFDRSGVEVYRRITGRDDCPTGFGIGLRLIQLQVEGTLDEERFWRIVADAYRFLTSDPNALQAVMGAAGWVDDFNDAIVRAFDAGVEHDAVLSAARQTRQEVRALLLLAHGLIEGPGKRLVVTLLAVKRGSPYDSLRNRDAGALLHQAEQQGLGYLLEGLDRTLRVARAHEDFRVEGERVVFPRRDARYPSLSVPELVDRVLAAAESVLALTAAIACVAVGAGVPLEAIESFSQVGLSPEGTAAAILAAAGWRGASVELSGSTLRPRGRAEVTARSLVQAGSLLPYLPVECTYVVLEGVTPEGASRTLEGPLEPLRRAAAASEEIENFSHFIEGYVAWRLDGASLLTREHVRKLVAVKVGEAVDQELPEAVRRLRLLRSLAQRVKDGELEESLTAAISHARSGALGLDTDREPAEPLLRLANWSEAVLPPPF